MIIIKIQITFRPNRFSVPVCNNFINFNFDFKIKKNNTIIDLIYQLQLYFLAEKYCLFSEF